MSNFWVDMLEIDLFLRVILALALFILSIAMVAEFIAASADHMVAAISLFHPKPTFRAFLTLCIFEEANK